MRTCGTCGRQNQPGVQFCAGCGDYLGWTDDEPEAAAPTPPPAEPEEPEEAPPSAEKPVVPTKPAASASRAGTRDGGRPIPSWAQPVGDRADRGPDPAPGPGTGGQQDREPRHRRPPVPERAEKPAPAAEPPAPGAPPAPAGRAAPVARPARPAREEARKAAAATFEPPRLRSVGHAVRALDEGRRVAEQQGRPDLGAHLAAAGERLAARLFPVAIVGEFKRGKSTLVNALLQTDVCPVDADIVTAVPTLVRHGEEATATALLQAPGDAGKPDGEPVAEPVDVDRLMDLVGETADPAWRRRLQSVEVRLPHRLLRTGLALVDTPGVGGLESAHGNVTLGALARTSALVFVTDASQELTAPEVDFLRSALARCPTGVCVVTKTDLYPQWRRIADLDRRHLAAAGIDMPVIPVSSFLRLRAWREPELNEESGFAPLFDWLRTQVVEAAAQELAGAAGRDLGFVQEQLRAEVVAEQQVIELAPEEGDRVVAQLRDRHERTRRLVADRAGWKQALSDGVEDLFADVRHDLSERLRVLTRETEAVIDQGDPKETWPDVEVWLQRRLVGVATANYDLLSERAQELAAEVAEQFRLESEVPLDLGLTAPADVLRGLAVDHGDDAAGGQRLARMVFAGRTAVLIPYVVFAVMGGGSLLLLATLGPLSLVLGAGIGRKLLRDERQRQLTYRRQQAKIACRRYLDEAAFVIGKDCQDSLRRTRRELRDEFETRAAVLTMSAERALRGAQRAKDLPPAEAARRTAELARRQRQIDGIGAGVRSPA